MTDGIHLYRLALPLGSSQSQHDPEHTLNVFAGAGKGLHQSHLSLCLPLPTESWVFTTQTEHGEYRANSWVSLERLYYICLFGERRRLMPRGMPRSQRTAWTEHRSRLICWAPHRVLREVFKWLVYFAFCRNHWSAYSLGQAWMVRLHVSTVKPQTLPQGLKVQRLSSLHTPRQGSIKSNRTPATKMEIQS